MPTGRQVLDLYAGQAWATRAHAWVRWHTCPFPEVAAAVPRAGRVLEVGCGHGLFSTYLALSSAERHVLGVDLDAAKVAAARAAAVRARRQGADVAFEVRASGELPPGPWDAITVVDVLYLLDPSAQRRLLADCAAALAPGGVLVVKEMGDRPRWKARWNLAQETVSVRLLGLTAGRTLAFLPPQELVGVLREVGLEVRSRRLDLGRPHPHLLLVGVAPRA